MIILLFKEFLQEGYTEPFDAPDMAPFWLVDMYYNCTDPPNLFTKDSNLRVFVAKFSSGCPDLKQVVHLGPPEGIEAYIQEVVMLDGMVYCYANASQGKPL